MAGKSFGGTGRVQVELSNSIKDFIRENLDVRGYDVKVLKEGVTWLKFELTTKPHTIESSISSETYSITIRKSLSEEDRKKSHAARVKTQEASRRGSFYSKTHS